jgi:diadenosine tetraphosphate (Ap4A) HIT family hydrolase
MAAVLQAGCTLCEETGGDLLWRNEDCRVVFVDDTDCPGYCRVVVNAHCAEMTDLPATKRIALMRVVFAVESVLRSHLRPDKINLASLGNQVPHLHWHIIPRYRDDPFFPLSIWGQKQRVSPRPEHVVDRSELARGLVRLLNRRHRS